MYFSMLQPTSFIVKTFSRSFASKNTKYRPISAQLRFHMDTKAVYGPQRIVREKRAVQPSELDLFIQNPSKKAFEKDTELLYGGPNGFRRACSVPKGTPIAERERYIRYLFRIPRGQRVSLFPQAYVPNKYLGLRRKKD